MAEVRITKVGQRIGTRPPPDRHPPPDRLRPQALPGALFTINEIFWCATNAPTHIFIVTA